MILLKTSRLWQTRQRYPATALACCCVLGITQPSYGQNVLVVTVVNTRWAVDQRDVGGDTAQGETPLLTKVKIENEGNEPVLLEAKDDIVISILRQNPKTNRLFYTLKGIYVTSEMMWRGTPEHIKLETKEKWADFYNLDNPGADIGANYLFAGTGEFKLTFQPGGEMELTALFDMPIPKSSLPMILKIKNGAPVPVNVPLEDLFNAAKNGDLLRVKTLFTKGADVNAKTSYGLTALMLASQEGHLDVVQVLLAKGAGVNVKSYNGGIALMLASEEGHLDVAQVLLAKGAEVNAKRNDGATALIQASQNGHLEVVQALLAKGADVNAKTNDGGSALDVAKAGGHADIEALLIQAGAKE